MARYPRAVWRPLPEHGNEGPNRPRLFIVHVIVGSLAGADAWFRREDVRSESHFGLGKGHETDPVRQWLDTDEEADTNWDANGISVTVETAGQPDEPFTDFQIAELIEMGVWAARTHGIPPHIAATADGDGFGWHSLHDAWNKNHHTCPGAVRIKQLREVVFPAIFARLNGRTVTAKTIAGADRHETAALLARTGFPGRTGGIVWLLATGSPDGDAVCNVGQMGPVLTVEKDRLPDATAAELARFKPDEVIRIGGSSVISDKVLEQARKAAG